jgi:uncharacterized protein (DUF1778 family)
MTTKEKKSETARFETRLPKEQKNLFKRAALIGGYSSMSDFIAESEKILASKRDSEIFFDALTNPPKANKELKKAAKEYKKLISK